MSRELCMFVDMVMYSSVFPLLVLPQWLVGFDLSLQTTVRPDKITSRISCFDAHLDTVVSHEDIDLVFKIKLIVILDRIQYVFALLELLLTLFISYYLISLANSSSFPITPSFESQ